MDTREIMIKAVHALLSSGSYDDLNEEQNSVVVEFETEIMKENGIDICSLKIFNQKGKDITGKVNHFIIEM